ncbi:MAG: glutathione S-transferase family protein [Vulcanimicrobiota bacterium]
MKLYNFPQSPNAIKVWATIHHLGLEVEHVLVEAGSGAMRTEEYSALNPNQTMPTLVDGDFTLWESNAIMQYLAHKAGDTALWPGDPRNQADVSRWLCWQLANWGQALRHFMFENLVKKMLNLGPADPAKLAEGTELFHRYASIMEAHLAGRPWLATDSLTLADYAVASPLCYASPAALPWDEYPNIQAWYGRIAKLPAWQKALPAVARGGRPETSAHH